MCAIAGQALADNRVLGRTPPDYTYTTSARLMNVWSTTSQLAAVYALVKRSS
jgi:hypothetical protein